MEKCIHLPNTVHKTKNKKKMMKKEKKIINITTTNRAKITVYFSEIGKKPNKSMIRT